MSLSAPQERETSPIRDYLGILRRRVRAVSITMLVALAAMTAYILHATPVYQASALMQITPQVSPAVLQANNASMNSVGAVVDVPTAIQVIESPSVHGRVEAIVPGAPPVTASQVATTNVVSLAVRSTNRHLAAVVANAYAQQYIALERQASMAALGSAIHLLQSRISGLQQSIAAIQTQLAHMTGPTAQPLSNQLSSLEANQITLRQQATVYQTAEALSTGGGQLVGAAVVPTSPVVPKPIPYLILAGLLGLLGGCALAFLLERLDDGVHQQEDAEQVLGGVPVVGVIPALTEQGSDGDALVALAYPQSPSTEAYRMLRVSIQFLQAGGRSKIIQFTSARTGDGKTTTVANLAVTLAQAGQRVLAVDCDLRRPQLHRPFAVSNRVGLATALLGQAQAEDLIVPVPGVPNLEVLPSGPVPPFPAELLSGGALQDLLQGLVDRFDVILVDSPPILPVADSTILASYVDVVVLVGGAGRSSRRDISAAMAREARVQAPVRGFILNRAGRSERESYGYDSEYVGQRSYAPDAEPDVADAGPDAPDQESEALEPSPAPTAGSNGDGLDELHDWIDFPDPVTGHNGRNGHDAEYAPAPLHHVDDAPAPIEVPMPAPVPASRSNGHGAGPARSQFDGARRSIPPPGMSRPAEAVTEAGVEPFGIARLFGRRGRRSTS